MSIFDEAQRLDPSGKIWLLEIDGTAFGAGLIRAHYSPIPYTSQELRDAANIVRQGAGDWGEVGVAGGAKSITDDGTLLVTANNSGMFLGFSTGQDIAGVPGSRYTKVKIQYRWVTQPVGSNNDQYVANYNTTTHQWSNQQQKIGRRADSEVILPDGWRELTIDMSQLTTGGDDWLQSQVTRFRVSIWQQNNGTAEIRKVSYVGIDQTQVDDSRLKPKPIWFDGKQFDYWPFLAEGIEFSSDQQSQPTLSIANQSGVVGAYLRAYQEMVGASVRLIQTYVKYLDARNFAGGNADADPLQQWTQFYYIDRPDYESDDYVRFTLSSPLQLNGVNIPTRQISTFCQWQARGLYGKGLDADEENGCSWNRATAKRWYNAKGEQVDDITKDECGGCVQDCRLRFGQLVEDPKAAILDYGGFISVRLID